MYACICAAVTESEVRRCIDGGADTPEKIGEQCQAGTGCGGCHSRLEDLIDERICPRQAA